MATSIVQSQLTLARWIEAGYPRQLREAASVSQVEMADEVGCQPPTINRWELGRHLPTGVYAVSYLSALEVLAARPGMPQPPEPG